jgi:REP element-mobilizing transposase RayT
MPRKLRVEYPGAIYHVMSRANGRKPVFVTDADRLDFLKALAGACEKTGWQVHAFCLLRDHFHLVVETPNANLVDGMRWFLSAYTIRFNTRNKRGGPVFSGRYKSLFVDGSGPGYLRTMCDYVHLNPVRARLLKPNQRLREYPWSSFGPCLAAAAKRPQWLRVDRLLAGHGIQRDDAAGRRLFEQRMEEQRAGGGDSVEFKSVRRGWCLGSAKFKAGLLRQMAGKRRPRPSQALVVESATAKAERIIGVELRRLRWKEGTLAKRAKGDAAKLAIAARLRRETTLTLPWIAERLHLGSWKSLNATLHRWRKANEQDNHPSGLPFEKP